MNMIYGILGIYILIGVLFALHEDRNNVWGRISGDTALAVVIFWPFNLLGIIWDYISDLNYRKNR